MFSASWTQRSEIKGHLKLTRDPFWYGLGIYEDEHGNSWDVRGVIGCGKPRYVQARLVAAHPNYYGTHLGSSSNGCHCWEPYTVEAPKPDLSKYSKTV